MDKMMMDFKYISDMIRRKREKLDEEEFNSYIERLKEEIDYQSLPREFIKNILDTEVDTFNKKNTYRILSMSNVIHDDEFASIEQILIDEIEYSWSDIDRDGGVGVIVENIKNEYNIKQ